VKGPSSYARGYPLSAGGFSAHVAPKEATRIDPEIAAEARLKLAAAARRNHAGEGRPEYSAEISPENSELTTASLTALVSDILRAHYGTRRSGAKLLAREAGCAVKAAENWLYGENAPGLLYALRLMRAVPELRAELMALADHAPEIDPETLAAVEALAATLRRADRRRGGRTEFSAARSQGGQPGEDPRAGETAAADRRQETVGDGAMPAP
jgi:hypothetical protein